jgi:hypothetical protein
LMAAHLAWGLGDLDVMGRIGDESSTAIRSCSSARTLHN